VRPLDRDEILALSSVVADPAVSVLLPVNRTVASHDAERLRAGQLLDEANDLVRSSHPGPTASAIEARLDHVAEHLDLTHPGDGLAVYVSADEEHVVHTPFPVSEQLTIEDAFATRQLLVGLARSPTVRVLVLSEHGTRLFEDHQGQLVEIHGVGFPITGTPPHEQNAPHRDLPIHEASEAEEHRVAYRVVDGALDRLPRPDAIGIVVVGAEREVAYFDEVSRHGRRVIGRVHGDHARSSPDQIERAVRPAIAAHVAELEERAVHEVVEGVGTGRVVTDFPTLWKAAGEGRGHRLVVEDDYSFPLHLTDGFTPGEQADARWTLDDAVDELIEMVVRAGGEVDFVRPGRLDAVGGIGLIVRYRS
jgi:hypothetical protein